MGHSALGHAGAHVARFPMGMAVAYRPGVGTYGYEHVVRDVAGRIAAKVVGHTPKRVRIEFRVEPGGALKRVAVDAESLS